jgi:aminoglycoside phosphotransferase family enzyme
VARRVQEPNASLRDEAHLYLSPDGRERLAELVDALRRPDSYGGAVGRVDAIETHMSWVFLTEVHAYKLKKPMRTDLFDHATIAARRRACATELRLNLRLAPSVYLAVVPVVRSAEALRVEGEGEIVDWLVKMRRLPADRMLDVSIERKAVSEDDIDHLSATLARFFLGAEPVTLDGTQYRERIATDIAAKRASLAQPRYGLDSADIDAVYAGQHEWLARHGALLEERAARVVDGHGDLRPEHVCLERPPVIIDCLEFSKQLRSLDPVSELAFLALECRRLGAAWIGERMLANYAARTGDRAPAELVPFYESHHALIRAAIAVWHLDDDTRADAGELYRERARGYLHMAAALLASFSTTPR